MGSALKLLFASLFFTSLALAQENLLPLHSTGSSSHPESTIWRNSPPAPLITTAAESEISKVTAGKYLATDDSPSKTFKFKIQTNAINSSSEIRTITLGKTAHDILLRKALLQKLGYQLPAISHLSRIRIAFKDHEEKKKFLTKLEDRTEADSKRWVVDEDSNTVTLQDVLIGEETGKTLDLSTGSLTSEVIQNQSVLASLIIPYTLTNIPESIDILSWVSGTIYGDGVKVIYPYSDEYTPTSDDIHWILKKIATLKRDDWADVVNAAKIPEDAKSLLVEKLISRRNSFLELFSMEDPPMEIDTGVEITRKDWPGYATRFSYVDNDFLFNPSESLAFTKTSIFGTIVNGAVSALNQLPVFHSDNQAALTKHIEDFKSSGASGKTLGIWGFPFASGELIFSRQIVTGAYLGDDLIQLVDNFGIRLSLGAQLSMDGLPTPVGAGLTGMVAVSRTYSHLKPIIDLKKAWHYGFQNIVVPYFTHHAVKKLDPIFDGGFENLPIQEQKQIYAKALQDFKTKLAPGESIIITDSLVADGKLSGDVNLYKLIDLSLTAELSELVMSRLHIHRKDENTFQIYKDFGMATQPSFGLEIGIKEPVPVPLPILSGSFLVNSGKTSISAATLPILRIRWGGNYGKTTTQYFSLHFDEAKNELQDLDESIAQLKILQQTMLYGSTEVLKKHIKPYLFENNFGEQSMNSRLLFYSHRRLKSASEVAFTTPEGEQKKYIRNFFGKSHSFDYSNTIPNILDFGYEYLTHNNISFGTDSLVNPGYKSNGHSKNHLLEFQAEEMPDGSLKDPFVKLSQVYNGWSLTKEHVQKLLDKFKKEYGDQLFPITTEKELDKMYLYTISLNILLYEKALTHLENLDQEDIRELFAKYGHNINHRLVADRIVKRIQEFKRTRSSKALLKAISIADRFLPAVGFIEFFGGKENILIYATVDGYKEGDQGVDAPVISNTIGIAGSANTFGPLSEVRRKLGMSEYEFFSLWILGRIL